MARASRTLAQLLRIYDRIEQFAQTEGLDLQPLWRQISVGQHRQPADSMQARKHLLHVVKQPDAGAVIAVRLEQFLQQRRLRLAESGAKQGIRKIRPRTPASNSDRKLSFRPPMPWRACAASAAAHNPLLAYSRSGYNVSSRSQTMTRNDAATRRTPTSRTAASSIRPANHRWPCMAAPISPPAASGESELQPHERAEIHRRIAH